MDLKTLVIILATVFVAVLSFVFAFWLYLWVKKQPAKNKKIAHIGKLIKQGANAFLKKEYMSLLKFAGAGAVLIFVFLPKPLWSEGEKLLNHVVMTAAFIFGMIFSAAAGKIGIMVATIANQKTAEAAISGISKRFLAVFSGGAVIGMAVVGSSLFGIALLTLVIGYLTRTILPSSASASVLRAGLCSRKLGAASIPRPRTSAPTLSVRSSWEFRKTIRAIPRSSPTMSVTMSGTLPEWG